MTFSTLHNPIATLTGLIESLGEAAGLEQLHAEGRSADDYLRQLDQGWELPDTQGASLAQRVGECLWQVLWADAANQEGQLGEVERALLTQPDAVASALHLSINAGPSWPVPGAFVLAAQAMSVDDEGAPPALALIHMPGTGLARVRESLAVRLGQALADEPSWSLLMEGMALAHQADYVAGATCRWSMVPIAEGLPAYLFASARQRQRQDVLHVLGAPVAEAADTLQALKEALASAFVQPLQSLAAYRNRLRDAREAFKALPAWLRTASAQNLSRYEARLAAWHQAQIDLAGELGEGASLEHYVQSTAGAWLKQLCGVALDPGDLLFETRRALPGMAAHFSTRSSFSELALNGLPAGDEVQGSDFLLHSALTYQGETYTGLPLQLAAQALLGRPLRLAFVAVRQQALSTALLAPMLRLAKAQWALSAFAGSLSGQLSDTQFQQMENLAMPLVLDDLPSLQVFTLQANGADLGGMLALGRQDSNGHFDQLLLYTPDAPRALQWQHCAGLHALHFEVAGWSANPVMAEYLLTGTAENQRQALADELARIAEKPEGYPRLISLKAQPGLSVALQQLAEHQLARQMEANASAISAWHLGASLAQCRQLVLLETQVQGARQCLEQRTDVRLQRFDDFLQHTATVSLNRLLGDAQGQVNPGQVIVTLDGQPFTFSQLMRDGYPAHLNLTGNVPAGLMSVTGPPGVDLGGLQPERVGGVLRKGIAARFAEHIEQTLLAPGSPGLAWRRTAYLELTRLQMSHAAVQGQLKGELDARQYQQLERMLATLHKGGDRSRLMFAPLQFRLEAVLNEGEHPWIKTLVPDALRDLQKALGSTERVEGVYVVGRHSSAGKLQALIYTPQAPDGVLWRDYADFARDLKIPGLLDYYKDRMRAKLGRWMAYRLNAVREDRAEGPLAPMPWSDRLAIHDIALQRLVDEVNDVYDQRWERVRQTIDHFVMVAEVIVIIATLPFPPAALVAGSLFAIKDSLCALKSVSEGDYDGALGHSLLALLNVAGAASDLVAVVNKASGVARLARPPAKFEIDPSLALSSRPKGLQRVSEGKYAGTWRSPVRENGYPDYFIELENGKLFQVRHSANSAYANLRVVNRRRGTEGAPVHLNAAGQWRVVRNTGTVGGADDKPADLLHRAFAHMSDDQLRAFFARTPLGDGVSLYSLPVHLRGCTQHQLEALWAKFQFNRLFDIEQALLEHLRKHRALPAWARQFLGRGQVLDDPMTMLRRRYPAFTEQQWAHYASQFRFLPEQRDAALQQLALYLEIHGVTPSWALKNIAGIEYAAFNSERFILDGLLPPLPPAAQWKAWQRVGELTLIPSQASAVPAGSVAGPAVHRVNGVGAPLIELQGGWYEVACDFANATNPHVAFRGAPVTPVQSLADITANPPQLARYVGGQWQYVGPAFSRPMSESIAEPFPQMLSGSREWVAQNLLREAREQAVLHGVGLTSQMADVNRVLDCWGRGAPIANPRVADPLGMLPVSVPERINHMAQVNVLSEQEAPLVFGQLGVMRASGSMRTAAQMLQVNGYEVLARGNFFSTPTAYSGELVVRHPCSTNLYVIFMRSSVGRSGTSLLVARDLAGAVRKVERKAMINAQVWDRAHREASVVVLFGAVRDLGRSVDLRFMRMPDVPRQP
ncbi:MAG: hypothetical protein PW845_01280 [Pseudomonas sp.]|nr:hypothetical protein [Pseudomonas sp.]